MDANTGEVVGRVQHEGVKSELPRERLEPREFLRLQVGGVYDSGTRYVAELAADNLL